MIKSRSLPRPRLPLAALLATLMLAAPLAAQDQVAAPSPAATATPPASDPVEMVSAPVVQPLPAPREAAPASRAPAPAPTPAPTPAPSAQATIAPAPSETPPADPATPASTGLPLTLPPLAEASAAPSSALGAPAFDWRWLVAGALLLATLIGAGLLWRQRKPKVLRLAAPPVTGASDNTEAGEPPQIEVSLDIPGASRSLMMFTLCYRITLDNRAERAVNGLSVAVQLASAQRGASNAAPLAAAQALVPVDRIGPHQSRAVSGEVQMPLAAITPVMQGQTALFIPLLHVTIEGEGQQALARSFVIGPPSGLDGRVQPLLLAAPPGSLGPMKARPIDPPPAA